MPVPKKDEHASARAVDEAWRAVRARQVGPRYEQLDDKQRGALHGILVGTKKLVVVSGPAGAGKSALIEVVALVYGKTKRVALHNVSRYGPLPRQATQAGWCRR